MKNCQAIQAQFSCYLDGAVRGKEMQAIASHLEQCTDCAREFAAWEQMQRMLAQVGPAKAPADLALRLRVAISRERASTMQRRRDRWQVRWENSIAPFLARATAGFASAVVLLGTVVLLIGEFAAPPPVAANDSTTEGASAPRLLYSLADADQSFAQQGPVVVDASINDSGRVYDYRVLSGAVTPEVQEELNNLLLMSVFTPARFYGQPVPGHAVLSFTSIAVHG
jgi:hypothetical protein